MRKKINDNIKEEINKTINMMVSINYSGQALIREIIRDNGGRMDIDLRLDLYDGEEWGTKHIIAMENGTDPVDVRLITEDGEEYDLESRDVIYVLEELSNL